MADYLKERLQAQGFKIGTYADFSSGKKYESMDKNPAPKGEIPQLFGPAFPIPGEFKLAKKAIMFTAYEQPIFASNSMKAAYIAIEKKINMLSFGLVLNFMELETKAKSTFNSTSLKMGFKRQIMATL
ncbi:MAG: hypothetical protein IPK03_16060 [Bacteroidetes bacterium]|nr:hypothetical protein [Bacteroidota bacterium]